MNKALSTNKAPKAVGPYSSAVLADGKQTVYVSGQLPIDVITGKFAGDSVRQQTEQSIKNIQAILNEAGMDLSDVTKTTILLADINDFAEMNEVYGKFFNIPYPARCAFQVAALPMGAKVEIDAVAVK